ncbi:hypothetical protein EDC04DRAFT_2715567 [Pisolithus marmoratus]|nr:hypothetical protein EDC04DRAFT_2715567 [Pisolithus marmoratus]
MSTPALAVVESAVASVHADPVDERSSVRFDSQCVVIPQPSPRPRRARLVTKRTRTRQPCRPQTFTSSVRKNIHPWQKQGLHPTTRVQSPTRCIDPTPLTPCLVHRSLSNDVPGSPSTSRRTRSKSPTSHIRTDLITVPLRPCCAACQAVTDQARSQGDTWMERFSPAAYYRRCRSTDNEPRTITVAGSGASAFYGSLARDISISVDEVDKRRRSSDSTLVTSSSLPDDIIASEEKQPLDSPSSGRGRPSLSPIRVPQLATHGIEEVPDDDEEDQLFPLPSPRRSPCSSATPSPTASLSSLQVGQVGQGQNLTNGSSLSNCSAESSTHGQHLCPPAASSSLLSLPKASVSSLSLTGDPPRAPSPSILASLPPLSNRQRSQEMVPQIPRSTSPESICLEVSQPNTSASHLPSTPKKFPTASTTSPSTSPGLSTSPNSRRLLRSFSGSSPRQIIADVIRGVGAFGAGGGGVNMQV